MTLARPDGSRKIVRYDDLSTADFGRLGVPALGARGAEGDLPEPARARRRASRPDLLPPGTLLERFDGTVFRVAHLEKATGFVEIVGVNEPYSQFVKIEELRFQFAPPEPRRTSARRARVRPHPRRGAGRGGGSRSPRRRAPRPGGRGEALFNLLRDRVPGARVLDLYAGTRGVGFEAVSRGAASAVLVEQDAAPLRASARAARRRKPEVSSGRRRPRPTAVARPRRARASGSTSCSPTRPTRDGPGDRGPRRRRRNPRGRRGRRAPGATPEPRRPAVRASRSGERRAYGRNVFLFLGML